MAIRPDEELIIDRTARDVQLLNNKGNYNASDLNRVEEWCQYLSDLLNEYGYYISIVTKTDWEISLGKQDQTSEINRIKTNIQSLKDAYYVLTTTPAVPSTSRLSINYIEANDIEKILGDLEFLIESMSQYFVYSGVAVSGQSHLWQNRFRRY